MNELIDKETLQEAIDKFGFISQIEMIKEECMELALAIQKLERGLPYQSGEYTKKRDAVIDEIADVTIVIQSAHMIFDSYLINERIKFKMDRLRDRIKAYTNDLH